MSDHESWRGRSALVTGGGAGIGRAIALEFAHLGADVVVSGRRSDKLDETVRLARNHDLRIRTLPGDLADAGFPARVDALVPELDLFVHAAVHFPQYGELEEIPSAEIARVHEVAVLAPMRIAARVLPGMKRRGFGRLVMLGSVAATSGAARQVAYASAKSALHGLVKSLALEGAPHGVTCNLVEPGLVLTERVLALIPEETRRALILSTPMRRAGTAEEIAAVVAFLCSQRASYVTGAIVPVAGGLGLGLFGTSDGPR